jgi:hypothetical protein
VIARQSPTSPNPNLTAETLRKAKVGGKTSPLINTDDTARIG